jgi:hypothetical protein
MNTRFDTLCLVVGVLGLAFLLALVFRAGTQ